MANNMNKFKSKTDKQSYRIHSSHSFLSEAVEQTLVYTMPSTT